MAKSHLELAFERFHYDNPHVYLLFDKFARQVLQAGYRRYSADAVIHRIRWHTSVVAKNADFRISNNHSPYYARLWMRDNPQHAGLFQLRPVTEVRDDPEPDPTPVPPSQAADTPYPASP